MAKQLPYLKFNAAEWINGMITLEDLKTQGAFINICAHYWFKAGDLTLTEINRRLKLKQATINRLIEGNHIKVTNDVIEISFLREQLNERGVISKRNSINGSKGGAPLGNKNAQISLETQKKTTENNPENNPEQPKTSNIEREKNKKENKNEREDSLPQMGLELSIKKILEDELWMHNIRHLTRGKNLEDAARSAFVYLETKPERFKQADLNELKKTTLSWLENNKNIVNKPVTRKDISNL